MKRPFLFISIFFSAGIVASSLDVAADILIFLFFALAPLVLVFRSYRARLFIFAGLLVILGMISFRVKNNHGGEVLETLVGKYAALEGRVVSPPVVKSKGRRQTVSFVFRARKIYSEDSRFRVNEKVQVFAYNSDSGFGHGDRLRLWGKVTRPSFATNPGQFDYRKYLARYGVSKVIQVVGTKSITVKSASKGMTAAVFRQREKYSRILSEHLSFPASELIKAFLLGKRAGIPENIRDYFVNTGTVHILSISGLHVSIIVGLLYFILRFAGLAQKPGAFLVLFAIIFYIVLSGSRVPVVRAGIMGSVMLLGIILEKERDFVNTIFIAFFILLLMNPAALFSPGFQLSFASVLAIILISPVLEGVFLSPAAASGAVKYVRKGLITSFAASLGAFPLVIYYFNVFSPVSIAANLIIVPVLAVLIIFGFLVILTHYFSVLAAGPFAWVTEFIVEHLIKTVKGLSNLPFSHFNISAPGTEYLIVYYGLLAAVVFHFSLKKSKRFFPRVLASFLWFATLFALFTGGAVGGEELTVTFLDMRKSTGVYIKLPSGNSFLFNGGARSASRTARIVKPYLKSRGIRRLDGLVLSSSKKSRWRGLETVVENFNPALAFLPEDGKATFDFLSFREFLEKRGVKIRGLLNKTIIKDLSGARIELMPEEHVACKLVFRRLRLLIMDKFEAEHLRNIKEDINVIFVPKNNPFSDEERKALADLRAEYLITSGAEDIGNLKNCGGRVLNLAESGAVTLKSDGNVVVLDPFFGDPTKAFTLT